MEKLLYIYLVGIGISTIQCYVFFELLIPYKVRTSTLIIIKILHNLLISVLLAIVLSEGLKLYPASRIYQIPLGELILVIYLLGEMVLLKKQLSVKYKHLVNKIYNYKLHLLSILVSMVIFSLIIFNPSLGKTSIIKPFLIIMQTEGMNIVVSFYGLGYFINMFRIGLTEGLKTLYTEESP